MVSKAKLKNYVDKLPNTSFLEAVVHLFNYHATLLPEKYSTNVYIAGGTAVHYWTSSRFTTNVKAEFSSRFVLPDYYQEYFDKEHDERYDLYFDRGYNPMHLFLHEDYKKDAYLTGKENSRIDSRFRVFVLTPLHLAISKLSRFSHQDRADISNLGKLELIDVKEFKKKALETLSDLTDERKEFYRRRIEKAINIIKDKPNECFLKACVSKDYQDSEYNFISWCLEEDFDGAFATAKFKFLKPNEAMRGARGVRTILRANLIPDKRSQLWALEEALLAKSDGHTLEDSTKYYPDRFKQRVMEQKRKIHL